MEYIQYIQINQPQKLNLCVNNIIRCTRKLENRMKLNTNIMYRLSITDKITAEIG